MIVENMFHSCLNCCELLVVYEVVAEGNNCSSEYNWRSFLNMNLQFEIFELQASHLTPHMIFYLNVTYFH
jgi:hypothetical protein